MSLNRTVSDLKVKKIMIQRKSGSRWVSLPRDKRIRVNTRYRLAVDFGNTGGKVQWSDEQYRKDKLNIRVVGLGFMLSSGSYKFRNKIQFYTDKNFTAKVTGAKYRTSFYIDTFETTHSDARFYAYLMFDAGTPSYNANKLRWDCGIYASVRNRVWRKRYTATV